jgi:hypothetical protein
MSVLRLDEWFKLHYRTRKSELRRSLVAGERPLMVRIDRELVIFFERTRSTAQILDEPYDRLKALSHLPIALFLWASPLAGRALAPEDRDLLGEMGAETSTARTDAQDCEPEALELLHACDRFVRSAMRAGAVSRDDLGALERETEAPIRACILAATRRELRNLHTTVSEFIARLGPGQWDELRVVICAGHQARYRQSTKSYFLRLLHESHGEGAIGERRVIYAENCRTEDEALDLVATHLLDREIGAMFLDSPLALQQDVLGEATRIVLDEIGAEEVAECADSVRMKQ